MKKIFITGSTDGLGLLAANKLKDLGHTVVQHARNKERAQETKAQVIGDISSLKEIISVANQVNDLGPFDSIIHNAGVYNIESNQKTEDGVTKTFAVNVLAPYVLSKLIHRPKRLIYLCSGMHLDGDNSLDDLQWEKRSWNPTQAYCDSKFHIMLLTRWFAREWGDSFVNSVDPGWVPTKMGGASAPDSLEKGAETQSWLAVSEDEAAKVSGKYFHHKEERKFHADANDEGLQKDLIQYLLKLSGY